MSKQKINGFDMKKNKWKMKEIQYTEGAQSLEPQKAHPTSEFILVSYNGGLVLLCLVCRLTTVVSE